MVKEMEEQDRLKSILGKFKALQTYFIKGLFFKWSDTFFLLLLLLLTNH